MASWTSKRRALIAAAFAAAVASAAASACAGGTAPDSATIANSGSTNFTGYKIVVSSGGSATGNSANRAGDALSTPKTFTLDAAITKQFFTDLAAAKANGAQSVPCMKSASFGSSTHVTWHDWTSPDLSCPPGNDAAASLLHDVNTIVEKSGITPGPSRGLMPMRVVPEPSPAAT